MLNNENDFQEQIYTWDWKIDESICTIAKIEVSKKIRRERMKWI